MAHILFISHTSNLGGPSHSLLKLVKFITEQHKAAVVAPGDGLLFEELNRMGIHGYRTGRHGLTRRSIPQLSHLIVRDDFDLVYGNNFSSGPRNALVAAKLAGRPFIWHIREMLGKRTRFRNAFFLRFADAIIAVSKASADSVQPYASQELIHVVNNGIELYEFDLDVRSARQSVRRALGVSEDEVVIVSVGTIGARKGQAYGVQAAIQLLDSYSNVSFAFLGDADHDPNYANTLRTQVDLSKVGNKIRFLGFHTDVPSFLVGSDIFLHTAAWDPHPRAVLEAMGASLPVVAFGLDGVREQVVDSETGYLIPFGDVDALVRVLRACLDDPSLRTHMGKQGRKRVQSTFTAEETARKISIVIGQLLSM